MYEAGTQVTQDFLKGLEANPRRASHVNPGSLHCTLELPPEIPEVAGPPHFSDGSLSIGVKSRVQGCQQIGKGETRWAAWAGPQSSWSRLTALLSERGSAQATSATSAAR